MSAPATADRASAARTLAAELPSELWIGGEWRAPAAGETFDSLDPATEQVVAGIAAADGEDVEVAVRHARAALESPHWRDISPHERTAVLNRLAEVVEEHRDELAELETLDNGAPLATTRAMIDSGARALRYYAGWPTKITGTSNPSAPGIVSTSVREPVGVCAGIVPWNAPFQMLCWKLAPALACANTVIVKPAALTSLTALRFAALAADLLPAGVFNLLTGSGRRVGNALVEHPGVDKISFTGSTEVGQDILRASAATMKRVTLELGGKSPNLVFADADLDAAATIAAVAFCANAGQSCVAATRVLVQRPAYDAFVERLVERVRRYQPGDPFADGTLLGPLISEAQRATVTRYVDQGQSDGATLALGGEPPEGPGFYVVPSVLEGVTGAMAVAREEIFGPVAAVMPFDDEAEAIALGNDTIYGLAATVWTTDLGTAHRVARGLRAGTVWVNTYGGIDPVQPFGGFKQSGLGREHGAAAIEAYTETKSITIGV